MLLSTVRHASVAAFLSALLFHTPFTLAEKKLEFVSTGKTPQYLYNNKPRQDLSASAYHNGKAFFGFDGGKNADFPEIRSTKIEDIQEPAKVLQRQIVQKDMEGATFFDGNYVFTSSLSQTNEDTADYRVLASFKIDDEEKVVSERYVYAREKVLNALVEKFGANDWAKRMLISFGKLGGLNVEALSISHKKGDYLVMGLRSPLWHKQFGAPVLNNKLSLNKGDAIFVEWHRPFDEKPTLKVTTVDLDNQGIRGMEYIPSLRGYLIIAGPVQKAKNFNLWFYDPFSNKSEKLAANDKAFKHLCRPETILHIEEEARIFVLSEESGKACSTSKYNYVEYKYKP